jgi:hypothetical protein
MAEIPVIGSATPDGLAYFIKADKGLLICDRVVQYNVSWNVLNAGKYIEGKQIFDTINLSNANTIINKSWSDSKMTYVTGYVESTYYINCINLTDYSIKSLQLPGSPIDITGNDNYVAIATYSYIVIIDRATNDIIKQITAPNANLIKIKMFKTHTSSMYIDSINEFTFIYSSFPIKNFLSNIIYNI